MTSDWLLGNIGKACSFGSLNKWSCCFRLQTEINVYPIPMFWNNPPWRNYRRKTFLPPTHSLSVARCPIQLRFSIELQLIWAVFIEDFKNLFVLLWLNLLRALPYYAVVKDASVVQPAQRRTAKTTMLRADAGRASSPPFCYCPCILSSLVHMPQVNRSGVAWIQCSRGH